VTSVLEASGIGPMSQKSISQKKGKAKTRKLLLLPKPKIKQRNLT